MIALLHNEEHQTKPAHTDQPMKLISRLIPPLRVVYANNIFAEDQEFDASLLLYQTYIWMSKVWIVFLSLCLIAVLVAFSFGKNHGITALIACSPFLIAFIARSTLEPKPKGWQTAKTFFDAVRTLEKGLRTYAPSEYDLNQIGLQIDIEPHAKNFQGSQLAEITALALLNNAKRIPNLLDELELEDHSDLRGKSVSGDPDDTEGDPQYFVTGQRYTSDYFRRLAACNDFRNFFDVAKRLHLIPQSALQESFEDTDSEKHPQGVLAIMQRGWQTDQTDALLRQRAHLAS